MSEHCFLHGRTKTKQNEKKKMKSKHCSHVVGKNLAGKQAKTPKGRRKRVRICTLAVAAVGGQTKQIGRQQEKKHITKKKMVIKFVFITRSPEERSQRGKALKKPTIYELW